MYSPLHPVRPTAAACRASEPVQRHRRRTGAPQKRKSIIYYRGTTQQRSSLGGGTASADREAREHLVALCWRLCWRRLCWRPRVGERGFRRRARRRLCGRRAGARGVTGRRKETLTALVAGRGAAGVHHRRVGRRLGRRRLCRRPGVGEGGLRRRLVGDGRVRIGAVRPGTHAGTHAPLWATGRSTRRYHPA